MRRARSRTPSRRRPRRAAAQPPEPLEDQDADAPQYLFHNGTPPRADNEVDPARFLKRMYVQEAPRSSLPRLVLGALVVVQQQSLVVAVYTSYLFHRHRAASAAASVAAAVPVLIAVTLAADVWLWRTQQQQQQPQQQQQQEQQSQQRPREDRVHRVLPRAAEAALCVVLLSTFAPLLRTLTQSYSSDTVHTLAALCGVAHLYLYDYQRSTVSTRLDCTVSLNAGFLMSLLLASRLEKSEVVAAFLLTSIVLLVLLPSAVVAAKERWPGARADAGSLVLNAGMCAAVAAALPALATLDGDDNGEDDASGVLRAYTALAAFTAVVCPVLLALAHRHKRVIRGPWDVVSLSPPAAE